MIEVKKDKKSPTYIITRTDDEGFHKQMNVTKKELIDLIRKGIKLCFNNN